MMRRSLEPDDNPEQESLCGITEQRGETDTVPDIERALSATNGYLRKYLSDFITRRVLMQTVGGF